MSNGRKSLPSRSWAYPLYDLALAGWMLGILPIVGNLALGRLHVAAILLGVLVLVSLAAVWIGRRAGITTTDYLDSSSPTRVRLDDHAASPPRTEA